MNRGEIRWYTFSPPDKRRPVLILTRDSVLAYLNEITIAPLTTTIRSIPSEVVLSPEEDGIPHVCAINFDHIQTVSKHKLGARLTELSSLKMEYVGRAISFALGIGS